MKTYVAYYRVSTQKQGLSGLGLDAQKMAVKAFLKCDTCVVLEYTEIESGKRDARPQLMLAISHAKTTGSVLVIAKLDRLSRNASFIFALKDSGVEFVCADMPDANTLTIGIFAVLAQHERELISSRTKAALNAKKAQGHILGTPANLTEEARLQGLKVRQSNAANSKENKQAVHLILSARAEGKSFPQIVSKLNELGYLTSRGKKFGLSSVHKLYTRTSRIEAETKQLIQSVK
ncbi:recombinase family protein [Rufibacter latericius]|uniref:Resolvase n=1 Tax=Rufibacter latericius TaxID=2487040 RepID=A0A3M9MEF2_9BACT|nr:recombinase family protein [Rufibacter latericius]RNI23565.1 resolvase [Rufibacter latericius]